ncbi:MAG: hypothetical protein IKS07_00695 [Lachnospiraceae bacterium]|nr:hypothetical protein [Lachnospiraceae bacterium]
MGSRMHIAICDDNVADRKQLERLLGRESDARKDTTGLLYLDSYGNETAILAHPMVYDVFFIDMCHTSGTSSLTVVRELLEKGVSAPFVLCCSEVDYRTQDFPEDTLFLDKPIRVEDLRRVLDHAQQLKDSAEKTIELREEKETHYVFEAEILYAVENGNYTDVYLTSGAVVKTFGKAELFFGAIEAEHDAFIMASQRVVLNCRHIDGFRFPHTAVMEDGASFKVSGQCMQYAKQMQEELHALP